MNAGIVASKAFCLLCIHRGEKDGKEQRIRWYNIWLLLSAMHSNYYLSHMPTRNDGPWVRINGTLSPAIQSQKELEKNANTSCSIFDNLEDHNNNKNLFHLLVDCGSGVLESIKNGSAQQGITDNIVPDAVLITHGHKDHIS